VKAAKKTINIHQPLGVRGKSSQFKPGNNNPWFDDDDDGDESL